MSLEEIEVLIDNLTNRQIEILMSDNRYIKRTFKLVKFTIEKIGQIEKMMEEIIDKDQEDFKYLCLKLKIEKETLTMFRDQILYYYNLTG